MLTVRPRRGSDIARQLVGPLLVGAMLAALLPASAIAAPRAYSVDLAGRTDFVAQTNNVQCVGASMQMMLNMIHDGVDSRASTQRTLQNLARAYSGSRPDGSERRGASVRGWAAGLTIRGGGPYKVVGRPTIEAAMMLAAGAMRRTGRPVGLLVWRGRHAWVMSGFRANGDPLVSGSRVTHVIVEDPLYPHGSDAWGPSPQPGQTLTIAQLGRQFVPRRSSWWSAGTAGQYTVVLPYELEARILRTR